MIRRLRWKFVAIIMTIVTLLMAVICAFLFYTLRSGLREDSMSVLSRVISQQNSGVVVWEPNGNVWSLNPFRDQEVSLPYFTVSVNHRGQAAVIDSQFYDLNDTDALLEVVQAGLAEENDSGVLENYHLRYLRKSTVNGWRIAFTDMTQEISTTRNMLRNLLLVGCAALAGFFFISLLLARWAVRPVERSWKQQRQFVADASHELKTPLTVVLSNVDMLQEYSGTKNARQQRWLGNIQAASEQMKGLVEEMLTLAWSDSGTDKKLVPQRVNFSDLVEDAILCFEPVLFEGGKLLEEYVTEDLFVSGDAGKLKRLIDILLDNARKYSPEGGKIWVTLAPENRGRVRLTVCSQGTPIPQEDLERIFERFYRADPARTSEGVGLGLSIAREIAKEHRGKLWAESSPELGNTFHFTLPTAKETGYK